MGYVRELAIKRYVRDHAEFLCAGTSTGHAFAHCGRQRSADGRVHAVPKILGGCTLFFNLLGQCNPFRKCLTVRCSSVHGKETQRYNAGAAVEGHGVGVTLCRDQTSFLERKSRWQRPSAPSRSVGSAEVGRRTAPRSDTWTSCLSRYSSPRLLLPRLRRT